MQLRVTLEEASAGANGGSLAGTSTCSCAGATAPAASPGAASSPDGSCACLRLAEVVQAGQGWQGEHARQEGVDEQLQRHLLEAGASAPGRYYLLALPSVGAEQVGRWLAGGLDSFVRAYCQPSTRGYLQRPCECMKAGFLGLAIAMSVCGVRQLRKSRARRGA